MRSALLLLLSALCMMSCSSGKNENQSQAAEYRIVYNVWHDKEKDDYEVFSMKMDGTDQRNISNWEGVDWVYHAAGSKVYFISDRDTTHRMYFLYEMDAYGQNIRKIYNQRLNDSWMGSRSNGNELIVDPRTAGDSAFHIISRSGQLLAKVYTGLPYYNDPFFSPDGQKIVFRGSKSKFKKGSNYRDELYLINDDGTDLIQLTHYPEDDTTANWWNYHAGPPFWEANSDLITYNSVQNGNSSLFKIRPDGSQTKKLTPDSLYAGWHRWSPDGQWIVFSGRNRNQNETGFDIFIMNYDTQAITQLTNDSTYFQAPVVVQAQ